MIMSLYLVAALWGSCIILTTAQYSNGPHPQGSLPFRQEPNHGPPRISQPQFPSSDYAKPNTPRPLILSHRQSLTHDGGFKYAFATDNGLQQGESIAPDGTRTGEYSYVDTLGKTITVKYTAGKEGFRILEGPQTAATKAASNSPQYPQQQQQSYQQPPPQHYSGGAPQIFRSPPAQHHYQQQPDRYTTYHSAPVLHQPPTLPQSPAPTPRYLSYKGVPPNEERRASENNLVREEPEHFDEPGKPHSFGNGYYFEFSG